ncbi:uncharacterized protein LOC133098092 [Eubalaena glacialis]|uniref:uncharacterized protein LOC133098092 n=1 Tax=Eubalaena glacialis TaxID=27606 RepID=UPI002A5A6197|nr:uncharacterized protein LOC133098092 [Eubalaena glacialis]
MSLTPVETPVVELRVSGGPASLKVCGRNPETYCLLRDSVSPFARRSLKTRPAVDVLGSQDGFQPLPALGPHCSGHSPGPPQAVPSAGGQGVCQAKGRETHRPSHTLLVTPKYQPLPIPWVSAMSLRCLQAQVSCKSSWRSRFGGHRSKFIEPPKLIERLLRAAQSFGSGCCLAGFRGCPRPGVPIPAGLLGAERRSRRLGTKWLKPF